MCPAPVDIITRKKSEGFHLVAFGIDPAAESNDIARVTFYRHEPPTNPSIFALAGISEAGDLLTEVLAGGPVRYFEEVAG